MKGKFMSTQTIVIIASIIAFIVIIGGISLYVLSDTFYFRREEKAHKRSAKIREEVSQQADAIVKNMKEKNVDMQATEETRMLEKAIKEIGYLSRDGRRSTDKIESVSAQLSELEKKALSSIGL